MAKCSVCTHEAVTEINTALEVLGARNWSMQEIAKKFGINDSSLSRHYYNHFLKTGSLSWRFRKQAGTKVRQALKLLNEVVQVLGT